MNATTACSCESLRLIGGMPLSGRPVLTMEPILSPFTSSATMDERVRSGPVSPPMASRPWQNPQCATNSGSPWATSFGGYTGGFTAGVRLCAASVTPSSEAAAIVSEERRWRVMRAILPRSFLVALAGSGNAMERLGAHFSIRQRPRQGHAMPDLSAERERVRPVHDVHRGGALLQEPGLPGARLRRCRPFGVSQAEAVAALLQAADYRDRTARRGARRRLR